MKEKRVNLEDIFYDKEGNFIPLKKSDVDIDEEISFIRDTFMPLERERFEELLADPEVRELFAKILKEEDQNLIAASAIKLMNDIETDNLETFEEKEMMKDMPPEEKDAYHLQKSEKAEKLLILFMAAIADEKMVKDYIKQLPLDYNNNNLYTTGYVTEFDYNKNNYNEEHSASRSR